MNSFQKLGIWVFNDSKLPFATSKVWSVFCAHASKNTGKMGGGGGRFFTLHEDNVTWSNAFGGSRGKTTIHFYDYFFFLKMR